MAEVESELDLNARVCVQGTRIRSLTATPRELAPGNNSATIAWDVTPGPCGRPGVSIRLNGQNVGTSGQKTFDQFSTQTYRLTAHARKASRTLGQVTVPYDTSSCEETTIPEALVRSLLRAEIATQLELVPRLSLRGDPMVEVSPSGVSIALRGKINVPGFVDPKIDVDMTIILAAEAGRPVVRYRRFAVDLDWPWWVTTLSAGVTKVVEEVVEDGIEKGLKPKILAALAARIDDIIASFPGMTLHSITTKTDEIEVTVCG